MSNPIDDGGPAFSVVFDSTPSQVTAWTKGMSLRDWFAGQALVAIMAARTITATESDIAKFSYEIADAMIAERKAKP